MTGDDFRKMALEIPTTIEASHMHHPDFRVAGKIFASLGVPDQNWAMVKLTQEQQRVFIEKAPKIFKPCSGAWGRQGATNVYLPAANVDIVRAALETAAQNVVSRKKKTPNAQRRMIKAAVTDSPTRLTWANPFEVERDLWARWLWVRRCRPILSCAFRKKFVSPSEKPIHLNEYAVEVVQARRSTLRQSMSPKRRRKRRTPNAE